MDKGEFDSLEKIFEAVNKLYMKADAMVFELETLGTDLRKILKAMETSVLAAEALAGDGDPPPGAAAPAASFVGEDGQLDIF